MTKQKTILIMLTLLLLLALPACGGGQAEESTEEVPSLVPTATEVPPTDTPTLVPTKTPPQTGPLATAAALAAQTTLVPPTPVGGIDSADIADDDYVAIFNQAWHTVEASYVRDDFNGVDWDAVYDEYLPLAEQVQSSEELWDLLWDMVLELGDSHSRFVPPSRVAAEFGIQTQDSAEPRPWSGIYMYTRLAREDEHVMAWCVSPDSMAYDLGMRRGDHILAVDGNYFNVGQDEVSRDQLREVLFGTGGDTVTLTIQQGPDQEPHDVTLDLGLYGGCDGWFSFVVSEDPYIGYIRIPDYDGNAASEIKSRIDEMEAERPLDGLILDQRHNPGGNSDESAAIFTKGIVGTVGSLRSDATRTVYRIRGVEWNETTPVVVLTDGNSHSAADYFPAAMQFLGRATIIGANSAGNTEGITGFPLADGTQIRLAVSSLILDDGTVLEGIGVTPDIYVALGDWGLSQTPFDAQLQAALDFLLDLLGG